MAFTRKSVLRIGIALVVVAAALAVVGRVFYTHVSESRLAASELWLAVGPLRQEIEAKALEHKSVRGTGRDVPPIDSVKTAHAHATAAISDDGAILLRDDARGLTLQLTPSIDNGAVVWHCRGLPERDMPVPCRGG